MPTVAELTDAALTRLDRLVAFDTVSRNSNLALVEDVSGYLSRHGIVHTIIPSPDETKASIFATIGPADRPGIVLSGHTDVVPVDGQTWAHDPFRLTRVGERVYGRGTSDMKGYVACMLAIAPVLAGMALRQPVHLALSYDEEIGCLGVEGILAHMQALGLQSEAALIGEPSRMGVVNAHKGSCALRTTVTGLSCHSSRPDIGVSAILSAVDIIGHLRGQAAALAAAPDSVGLFNPPYPTLTVGTVHGGTAQNAIPGDCRIEWDIRATRQGQVDRLVAAMEAFVQAEVLPAMRARHAASDVTTVRIYDAAPMVPEPGSPAESLAKALSGANHATAVPYCSEAGAFQAGGIPSVICGPGDIAQAHTADEFIEVGQLAACMQFLQRLAERIAA